MATKPAPKAPKAKPAPKAEAPAGVTTISESDLMEAAKAAGTPEQAAEALALFDRYQSMGGTLPAGIKRMRDQLKRLVK